jgi:hypothetical protein
LLEKRPQQTTKLVSEKNPSPASSVAALVTDWLGWACDAAMAAISPKINHSVYPCARRKYIGQRMGALSVDFEI